MRKINVLVFTLVLMGICGITAQAQENLTSKVKIGILIPLSGFAAEYGVAIKNGAELAIADNKENINQCEFIYEDSEYHSAKTATAFHRMAGQGMNLVYAFGGPMSEVLAPLAEKAKIALMCTGIDSKLPAGKDFVVRTTNTGLEYGKALSDYLLSKGKKRVAIVNTENQYLNSLVAGFIESSKDKFEVIDVINMLPEDSDFKPVPPKLLKGNYDAIGLFMLPGQLSSLSRLFKSRKDSYLFFGSDFLESKQEIEASLGVLEGAVYANNFVNNDFRASYIEKYKSDSQIKYGGEAYDVISLVINALCSKNQKITPDETIQFIKSVKPKVGVQGLTSYTETKEGDKYFKAPVQIMSASTNGFGLAK